MDEARPPRPEIRLNEGDIENLFSYGAPDEISIPKHQEVDAAAKAFARMIRDTVPPGADRTLAIRTLQKLRMECNAAIAMDTKARANGSS